MAPGTDEMASADRPGEHRDSKRKRGFSWAADGEDLLRQSKPRYFDGPPLPRTVPLSRLLSEALERAR